MTSMYAVVWLAVMIIGGQYTYAAGRQVQPNTVGRIQGGAGNQLFWTRCEENE